MTNSPYPRRDMKDIVKYSIEKAYARGKGIGDGGMVMSDHVSSCLGASLLLATVRRAAPPMRPFRSVCLNFWYAQERLRLPPWLLRWRPSDRSAKSHRYRPALAACWIQRLMMVRKAAGHARNSCRWTSALPSAWPPPSLSAPPKWSIRFRSAAVLKHGWLLNADRLLNTDGASKRVHGVLCGSGHGLSDDRRGSPLAPTRELQTAEGLEIAT